MTENSLKLTSRKNLFLIGFSFFLIGAFIPTASKAANKKILVYYCDCDAWGTAVGAHFIAGLQSDATNTVTGIDTSNGGVNCSSVYCPGVNATTAGPNGEIWNNFDQVWDVRYINQNSVCPPTGASIYPDFFSACWQTTAQDYVTNHCGSLFMLGENDGFESRWYGDLQFLLTLGAISSSFTLCPVPNANGMDFGGLAGNLPVVNLPGAANVYFGDEGGIPSSLLLSGTSFVNVAGSNYTDGVARSAAAGWNGSAGAFTNFTGCNLGKASVFLDMDGWDSANYSSGGVQDTYVKALANWFGIRACVCGTPTNTPTSTPTNTPGNTATNTPTNTPTNSPTNSPTPVATNTPTNTPTITPTNSPTNTPTLTPTNTPTPTYTPVTGVSISETVSETNAQPGDTLTYTINVTVTGGSASNLVITDPLASSVSFVGFTSSPGGTTTGYNSGTGQLTWTLPTPLAPGTYQITYQVKVNGNFASGTISNTASATDPSLSSPVTSTVNVNVTSQLHLWPNPFNPNYAVGGVLKASVVPPNTAWTIYSVSGELVWNLTSITGGEMDWNGVNNKGSLASPGIYYYVIKNGSTTLLSGKLLLLTNK